MSVDQVKTVCLRLGNAHPQDLSSELFMPEDRGMDRMTSKRSGSWKENWAKTSVEEESRRS